MSEVLKKFTKGNVRKSIVNFAFSGYADVIKYQEKPMFSCECMQITEARIISTHSHKTRGSHLKGKQYRYFKSLNLLQLLCPFECFYFFLVVCFYPRDNALKSWCNQQYPITCNTVSGINGQ